MSVIRTRKFREIFDVDYFLGGGVIGGTNIIGGQGGIYGVVLVGLTLIINKPGAGTTVTFVAGADSHRLTFKEVKAQIETALPTILVEQFDGRIALKEVTPAGGVTISKDGTANAALGFQSSANTVGTVYGGMGAAAPSIQGAYSTNDNMHVILTLE